MGTSINEMGRDVTSAKEASLDPTLHNATPMKSNNSGIWRMAALTLAAGITTASATAEPAWSWGPAQKQLRMGVSLEYAPDAMPSDVLIRLENVGKDLNVNLGITVGNGEVYYPRALFLLATDSAGVTHRFDYSMRAAVWVASIPSLCPCQQAPPTCYAAQ